MIKRFSVLDSDNDIRLDVFLASVLSDFSRSHIKTLIDGGKVLLNDKIPTKSGVKVYINDDVSVVIDEPKEIGLKAEDVEFEIVYEDDDLFVINKPQGLVVHPCSSTKDGTLVNGLLFRGEHLSSINGEYRPGIVHRLDKNTSGLMLVAKNDLSHRSLSLQISSKSCKRKYLALLNGVVKSDEGHIETYIARSKNDRKKMAVCKENEGKLAITDYIIVKRFSHYTLCEFSLKTGRTHQIRVHAKHIGHTVVGDDIYGEKDKKFGLNGQLLHSYYIEFTHPTNGKILSFTAPLPSYFQSVLDNI